MGKRTTALSELLSEGQVWFGKRAPRGRGVVPLVTPAENAERVWPAVQFGVPELDELLPAKQQGGGLAGGVVHEWSLLDALECGKKKIWYPPLFVLSAILGRSVVAMSAEDPARLFRQPFIGYIGRRCWPTPYLFQRTFELQTAELQTSGEQEADEGARETKEKANTPKNAAWSWQRHALFIDPEEKRKRLLVALKLLGSPAFAAVVVDGSGMSLLATRRLQLAAHTNNAVCMLVRPSWECGQLSAAHTRWKVRPVAAEEDREAWELELFQAKGAPAPLKRTLAWRDHRFIAIEPLEHKDREEDHNKDHEDRTKEASQAPSQRRGAAR